MSNNLLNATSQTWMHRCAEIARQMEMTPAEFVAASYVMWQIAIETLQEGNTQ